MNQNLNNEIQGNPIFKNYTKTENNVKIIDLVITIKSMLQEIKNAEASLN